MFCSLSFSLSRFCFCFCSHSSTRQERDDRFYLVFLRHGGVAIDEPPGSIVHLLLPLFQLSLPILVVSIVGAHDEIPKNCEAPVTAHIVAVVKLVPVCPTLPPKERIGRILELETRVGIDNFPDSDPQPQPKNEDVRAHDHVARDWDDVGEQVLNGMRVLAADTHIDLELVMLLVHILCVGGRGRCAWVGSESDCACRRGGENISLTL